MDFNFTVVAANLAVVGLGVQLGIHDIVVDELHQLQHCIDVLLHIGNLYIADGTAGRQLLEFRLEAQLGKGIDFLRHMDMVGVGDIALVRDTGNHAEALLQALGEFISGGFQGCAVQGEVDIMLCLPGLAGIVHMLHHPQGEGLGLLVGMGFAGHILDALV